MCGICSNEREARLKGISRRSFVRAAIVGGFAASSAGLLAACGGAQVVEVTKEVPVETVVQVTREVPVEKVVTKEVEKIVTQVVEKIVTVTAAPAQQ